MSLYGMMRTGVSGMNAQSNRLGTVADNIANSGTMGYKRAYTEFSALILPSGGGDYSSGAVKTTVRNSIADQGLLQFTSSTTDLAIQGEGFFMVENSAGERFLTRAGSFVPDAEGRLVNAAGYFLVGSPPGELTPNRNTYGVYSIIPPEMQASPSTRGTLTSNLPATDPVGSTYTRSVSVYTGLGEELTVDVQFEKTADHQWTATAPNMQAPVVFNFNPNTGQLIPPVDEMVIDLPVAPANQEFTLSFAGTTQFAVAYQTSPATVNGLAPGTFQEIQISEDGMVSAINQNGAIVNLFRIPLATVNSPDRLSVLPGNVFQANINSGAVSEGFANQGKLGTVVAGALEGSNVDIAEELTSMIESQRNYTANSKVFQTGADLLDVLVNLKR